MHSLRRRAALAIALLTIVIVGIHSAVLYSVADDQEDALTDQILSAELNHLIEQYHRDSHAAFSHSQFLTAYVVRDKEAVQALPAHLRELRDGQHELAVDAADMHVAVRSEGDVRFIVALDVTPHEARVRRYGWFLLFGVVFAAAVASVLGYGVAGVIVRPVTRLADQVQRLGPAREAGPIGRDYPEQEMARLAQAFDGYLDRVAEVIEREQEFTAFVSHELRTPLTAIQTGCELLLQQPALGDAERRRVESIARASTRIAQTVQALFLLVRDAGAAPPERIALRACIEEAAESVAPLFTEKHLAFELEVAPTEQVVGNRSALLLVITNLLRNAAGYTDRGFVRVRFAGATLSVEDSGPGIAPADLPRIFDRFYRGTGAAGRAGSGLGLAIVKRLCDCYGWRVSVESVAGSGTCVRLVFSS